ncbi:hypothetical protein CC99x_005305 [Candidatus Berkiella cookevillensis]|uniref:Type IV secretion protein IcmC n=1 Tax=Candidatus Berkiella cookevillensis TaxID=437022 RepID=A0A0Q9YVJ5_9GAMM|nr:hypothetical protein [Candidatus Berkiella cookevillensis]MCS5708318.1 hypothetical protein [Candidatus Berkiella cookevillensis]
MLETESFNLESAFSALTSSFYSLEKMLLVLSYIIGLFLVLRGLMMYRAFANQTYGSAQRGEIAGPMVFLIVGIMLIYLPSTMNASLQTIFGTSEIGQLSSLASYQSTDSSENWLNLQNIFIKYLKLVGFIAFLRGWIILSKMGHPGAQPGSIGKGITHIFGGVVLINLVDTINILGHTFGIIV